MSSYAPSKNLDFSCEIIKNKVLIEFPVNDPSKAKYLSFDKVTVLLKNEHKTFLDLLAKRIHKSRIPSHRAERITANTIIRCLIDLLNENQGECVFSNIHTEMELKEELRKIFPKNLLTTS